MSMACSGRADDSSWRTSLYHPDTVDALHCPRRFRREPGSRIPMATGTCVPTATGFSTWTTSMLRRGTRAGDAAVPVRQTRMVYTVNQPLPKCSQHLPRATATRVTCDLSFRLAGTRRPTARRAISRPNGVPPDAWRDVILQGPTSSMWRARSTSPPTNDARTTRTGRPYDLETLAPDAIPVTSYKPRGRSRRVRRGLHPLG